MQAVFLVLQAAHRISGDAVNGGEQFGSDGFALFDGGVQGGFVGGEVGPGGKALELPEDFRDGLGRIGRTFNHGRHKGGRGFGRAALGGLEHLVVAGQPGNIGRIRHKLVPEQLEQVVGVPGLRVERVQAGLGDLAAGLGVAVQPAGVEGGALPAVVDDGEGGLGCLRGSDFQESAAAFAAGIFAVELNQGVFADGQRTAGSKDVGAARFAGGQFREAGVKGSHKSAGKPVVSY